MTPEELSKLISEARQLASIHASYTFAGGDIGYVVKDRFITAIRALCDALESVAKERDEKAEAIENLCGHIAELAESREDLIAERDKVAKERDALRDKLAKVADAAINDLEEK